MGVEPPTLYTGPPPHKDHTHDDTETHMYLPKENKKDKPRTSRDVSWTADTDDGDGDGDGDRRRLCTSAQWAWAGRGRDRHGNHRCVCRQSAQRPSRGDGEALLW